MNKIPIIISLACLFISCEHKVNFNELMEDDYISTSMEFPDKEIHLYEVRAVMSGMANSHPEIEASSTIIQIGKDSVKEIYRVFNDNRIEKETDTVKKAILLPNMGIELDSVNISLDNALGILSLQGSVPGEPFMTFRKIPEHPSRARYIFGSKDTYYITIDATTGNIERFENPYMF